MKKNISFKGKDYILFCSIAWPVLGAVWHPRFSPDGEMIVFDCYKKQKKDVGLYIINKDGNNLTQLTINKSYDGQPYWSSDGYIYFASDCGGKDGHYQIWRFKL